MVVIGAALAAGGALPFAPMEVALAALVLAVIALARDRRAVSIVGLGGLALALGATRATLEVRAHELAMARANAAIPRTARCGGTVTVEQSPVRVRGALRWGGALRDGQCDGVAWSGPVTLYGGPELLARGDEVDVIAQLAPPTRLWNEGDPRPREARQASARSGGAVDARIKRRGRGILAASRAARER